MADADNRVVVNVGGIRHETYNMNNLPKVVAGCRQGGISLSFLGILVQGCEQLAQRCSGLLTGCY